MEALICSQLVRSTDSNLSLQLLSEVEGGLVELSPYLWNLILPLGGWRQNVVEFSDTLLVLRTAVGVKKPTHTHTHTHTRVLGPGTPFNTKLLMDSLMSRKLPAKRSHIPNA